MSLEISVEKYQSQDLFVKVIKTLPISPHFAEIDFIANGVELPGYETTHTDNDKRYLDECRSGGIMPYSKVKFEYSDGQPLIPTYTSDQILTDCREEIVNDLLNGGRFYQVSVDLGRYGRARYNFEPFRDRLLDSLLDKGYKISHGDLWLSTYHQSGYNEGTYRDSGISFGVSRYKRNIRFEMGPKLEPEDAQKLKDWFGKVTEDYLVKADL